MRPRLPRALALSERGDQLLPITGASASDRGWLRAGPEMRSHFWVVLVLRHAWLASSGQPCRCLCRGFSQITITRPCRRITLHLSQIFLTLGLTFISFLRRLLG